MRRTAVVKIDHNDLKKSTCVALKVNHDLKKTGELKESDEPVVGKKKRRGSAKEKDTSKGQSTDELMRVKDRFYFNQYFPIAEEFLDEAFLQDHVHSEEKRELLKSLARKRCSLLGVVGRRAFHIFDATHRTWICSSKELGY